MTYCVAIKLDAGLILASDSRTNAGVDHVSTFSKMRVFEVPGERVIVLLSSGNLAVTQAAINTLERGKETHDGRETLWNTTSLFNTAMLVGDALRDVQRRDGPYLSQGNIDAHASLIVAGQIQGEDQRVFLIYPQGNFIEATDDTPFFQLGEAKYGKPILDRVINRATSLKEAAKCVLVSYDSTMRSNISVGPPIDMLWYPRDSLRVGAQQRVLDGDPYFTLIRSRWGGGLRKVFGELPDPDWFDNA